MTGRILAAFVLALTLAACGVKTDLDLPNGALPQKDQTDPSKPPQPLGQ